MSKSEEKIKCPYCDKEFKSLMSHLKNIHKVNLKEFQKQNPSFKLTSESTKRKISKTSIASGCGKWFKGTHLSEEHKRKISEVTKGEKNPFYGKKHTPKTCEQMSKNHADFTGDKNPLVKWLNKEEHNREEYSKLHKQKWVLIKQDKEKLDKIVDAMSKRSTLQLLSGKTKSYGKGHKNGFFYSKKQDKEIYYRSSYELFFLMNCENNDHVLKFDTCNFYIDYEFEGRIRKFIPDFLVHYIRGKPIFFEIKPKNLISNKQNKAKFLAAEKYALEKNWYFIVFTQDELFFDIDSREFHKKVKNLEFNKETYEKNIRYN